MMNSGVGTGFDDDLGGLYPPKSNALMHVDLDLEVTLRCVGEDKEELKKTFHVIGSVDVQRLGGPAQPLRLTNSDGPRLK